MSDNDFHEWLEKNIESQSINCFNYSEFTDHHVIGEGGFGVVKSTEWKNRGIKVALKSLKTHYETAIKDFVKELKLLRRVYYHPNINKFLGVTKVSGQYVMVLQFADGGNLQSYLKNYFPSLTWQNKFKMANEITTGLMCLHAEQIVHRDLHDKNILVHQGSMVIADLGLSKELDTSTAFSTSALFGLPAFIEPQHFINDKYKRDKRSDIYSLGSLFWEISSGDPPFKSSSKFVIANKIINGERESPIKETPAKYVELYQQCWNIEPDKRPDIQRVFDILRELLRQNENNIEIPNILIDETDDISNENAFLQTQTSNMEMESLRLPNTEMRVSNDTRVSEEDEVESVYYSLNSSIDSYMSSNTEDNRNENRES